MDLHHELDTAVADAYGWPANLTDSEILHRLVTLNRQRAEEEKCDLILWLRSEYQEKGLMTQVTLDIEKEDMPVDCRAELVRWPTDLPRQIQSVQSILSGMSAPATAEEITRRFEHKKLSQARVRAVESLLQALGHVRRTEEGRFAV